MNCRWEGAWKPNIVRLGKAGAAGGLGAIAAGLLTQLMQHHTREHSVHTGLA